MLCSCSPLILSVTGVLVVGCAGLPWLPLWTLGSSWRFPHQAPSPQPHLGDEVNYWFTLGLSKMCPKNPENGVSLHYFKTFLGQHATRDTLDSCTFGAPEFESPVTTSWIRPTITITHSSPSITFFLLQHALLFQRRSSSALASCQMKMARRIFWKHPENSVLQYKEKTVYAKNWSQMSLIVCWKVRQLYVLIFVATQWKIEHYFCQVIFFFVSMWTSSVSLFNFALVRSVS